VKHISEARIEEETEVKRRRGKRRKQLLDDLKKMTGYWKFKEEALYSILWRIRLGRGYGPAVRQTTE
jgi:hypothetical protein